MNEIRVFEFKSIHKMKQLRKKHIEGAIFTGGFREKIEFDSATSVGMSGTTTLFSVPHSNFCTIEEAL